MMDSKNSRPKATSKVQDGKKIAVHHNDYVWPDMSSDRVAQRQAEEQLGWHSMGASERIRRQHELLKLAQEIKETL